jgi:dihydrofolate reductase
LTRRISFVLAFDRKKVIGKDGGLPWRLPDDMKHVREVTTGKPLIMGRRTYASIGRPLRGRTSIVLTRDPTFHQEGVLTARTPEEALALAGDVPEVIVFGGAEVFRQFLPIADDTYFDFESTDWLVVENTPHPADDRHPYPFTFFTLDRVRKP